MTDRKPRRKEAKGDAKPWDPVAFERAVAFGKALRQARLDAGFTQEDIESTGRFGAQSTWSGWENPHPDNGRAKQVSPEQVFAIEEFFKLEPGSLSQFLGYLPTSIVKDGCSFDLAIAADDDLDEAQKRNLRQLYREFTSS